MSSFQMTGSFIISFNKNVFVAHPVLIVHKSFKGHDDDPRGNEQQCTVQWRIFWVVNCEFVNWEFGDLVNRPWWWFGEGMSSSAQYSEESISKIQKHSWAKNETQFFFFKFQINTLRFTTVSPKKLKETFTF